MKVNITYFGQLAQLAGRPSDNRECPDRIGLPELLATLAGQHGPEFRSMVVDEAGRPRSSLLIVVNGEAVSGSSARVLEDGDQVTFLTPIAGG